MNLTPNDLAVAGVVTAVMIWIAARDDMRWIRWIRRWNYRRKHVLPPPDEHSPGIMASRRDVNVGNWT